MSIMWNFPESNGEKISLEDINVSYNSIVPYKLLIRDICNTFLTQSNDNSLPVKIEFKSLQIPVQTIPGIKALDTVIKSCKDNYLENLNDIGVDFYNQADKICNSKSINVLRISSYNTKTCDLSGKDMLINWRNYLEKNAVSYKNGVKSVCKSSIFQCSKIRTAFFSSLNNNKVELSQGISALTSNNLYGLFIKGVGYYGRTEGNLPLYRQVAFDKEYNRSENGLDIYILGTDDKEEYENQFVIDTLDLFESKIMDGSLEVDINDIKLNKESLKGDIVEKDTDDSNEEKDIDNPNKEIETKNYLAERKIDKIQYFIYLINKDKSNLSKEQQHVIEYITNNLLSMPKFTDINEFSREIGISAITINVVLLKVGVGSYKRFYEILCRLIAYS